MKLLVISDVHSNIKALQAIEAQEKWWDAVLFAGDMVDYGLYPHEVIAWMKKNRVMAVAGNHDIGLVRSFDEGVELLDDPYQAESFCQHNLSVLTKEDIEYLRNLPLELTYEADGVTYFMTHIHTNDDEFALLHHLEQYHAISSFDSYWQEKVGETNNTRCLIFGHTHHCMMVQLKKHTMVINPGATGYRLGADVATKGADYIVIENGIPSFRWADYSTQDEYKIVVEKMKNLEEWQRNTGKAIFKPEE